MPFVCLVYQGSFWEDRSYDAATGLITGIDGDMNADMIEASRFSGVSCFGPQSDTLFEDDARTAIDDSR